MEFLSFGNKKKYKMEKIKIEIDLSDLEKAISLVKELGSNIVTVNKLNLEKKEMTNDFGRFHERPQEDLGDFVLKKISYIERCIDMMLRNNDYTYLRNIATSLYEISSKFK